MRSETPPAPAAANDRPAAAPAPPRRLFIVLMIFLTAVLFAGMVSLLFYNWATSKEPSSVMVVEGTPKFDGVLVTIEGVRLKQPHTATLSADRSYSMPFYLDHGFYTIRLTRDGRTLLPPIDFEIGPREGKKLSLLKHEDLLDTPATGPTTSP